MNRRHHLLPLLLTMAVLAALAALSAGTAYAQTPDGQTPAEEEVCNELSGAAFGLCNAYCEAMDCELLDDGDDSTWPSASEKACLKVKDNFIKITGDAELPCECPVGTEGCLCDETASVCEDGLSCDPVTNTCVADDPCPVGTPGCLDGQCLEGEFPCFDELTCDDSTNTCGTGGGGG